MNDSKRPPDRPADEESLLDLLVSCVEHDEPELAKCLRELAHALDMPAEVRMEKIALVRGLVSEGDGQAGWRPVLCDLLSADHLEGLLSDDPVTCQDAMRRISARRRALREHRISEIAGGAVDDLSAETFGRELASYHRRWMVAMRVREELDPSEARDLCDDLLDLTFEILAALREHRVLELGSAIVGSRAHLERQQLLQAILRCISYRSGIATSTRELRRSVTEFASAFSTLSGQKIAELKDAVDDIMLDGQTLVVERRGGRRESWSTAELAAAARKIRMLRDVDCRGSAKKSKRLA
jgi:hypothetical protein